MPPLDACRETPGRPGKATRGFSLIELLTVMSIMTLMMVLVRVAVTGISQGQNFATSVYDLQYLVRQAKQTAMAQNTFVWLGFQSTTNSSGNPTLIVSAVASRSGLSSDISTGNYQPVMKPVSMLNVSLTNSGNINLSGVSTNYTDVSQSTNSFSQAMAGAPASAVFTTAIVFSPDGRASLNPNTIYRGVGIGLKGGPQSMANPQIAAIQIAGYTGQPTVFRQ